MARVRGVYLRKPPKGPTSYTSKEAALAASPTLVVTDAAFRKHKLESAKNAASRVNSGERSEWPSSEYFAVWEYAKDVVLRVKPGSGGKEESVEVVGFVQDGEVIGEDGDSVGTLESLMKDNEIETGGWLLLIGLQPNVPEGWGPVAGAAGVRGRRKRGG
jgi:hypothetical protein